MKTKFYSKLTFYIILATLPALLMLIESWAFAEKSPVDPFPLYDDIKSSVEFWKKVYGEYSTTQGIIHDRRNLLIIYEIITLKDGLTPGAAKSNQKKVEQTKNRYEQLLKTLLSDNGPRSSEAIRVQALFADPAVQALKKDAHCNIRFQLGQKNRFRAGVIRSGAYFDEILGVLKSYGLPEDLAYLPHVESSFDYRAYSKFGAAGIWQFTHGTGRKYLKIDYTVDERRDPILATHAAARFLKENYEALGNWPMAVTAYNHGTRGMLNAQQCNGDYEGIFNCYNGPRFGFASRNFYPEFLAAREVARNYHAYFGDLKFEKSVQRRIVEIPGYIAIEDLARHFCLDLAALRELNPALREPVYSGQKYIPKGYRVYLPGKIASGTEYAATDIPARLLKPRQKPSLFYRVQRGDTANKIARQHGVRLNDLILVNQLNSRATIYLGQNLRLPVEGEKMVLASLPKAPATADKSVPAPIIGSPAPEVELLTEAYTPAEEAESVEIAALPSTPEPAAKIDTEPPSAERPSLPAVEVPAVNPAVVIGNLSVEKIITVKGKPVGLIQVEPEETLGHYADWLQILTQHIRRLNGFPYGEPIHVGQKIKIPFGEITQEQFEEKRYEYHKEIEEDFFAVYRVEKTDAYVIEKGDSLWALCHQKFELPSWILKKYNPETDFDRLIHLKKLRIPVIVKIGENAGHASSDPGVEEVKPQGDPDQ